VLKASRVSPLDTAAGDSTDQHANVHQPADSDPLRDSP
jgi:hypothetical protein